MRAAVLSLLLLAGCFHQRGSIQTPQGTVVGLTDAGKPATMATETKGESLPIAAGSRLVVTKSEALPAIPATKDTAAIPAQPAKEVTELLLSKDTVWAKTANSVKADTGTVDTSIRQHEIDVSAAQPLLYAALLSMIGVGVGIWLKYPTVSYICGASSVVFFLAWKVSGMPPWFYAVGIAGLVGAGALWLGHRRGEKDSVLPTPPTP